MQIIAEIGQNHNGDIDIARKMIRKAKKHGAHAAKFQLYDVDKIFSPNFEWYKEAKSAQLNKKDVFTLAKECIKQDIEFMASVFDLERFEWTEEIKLKRYKVASRSVYEKKLIDAIAKTGKNIIVALGMYKGKGFPKIKTSGRIDFLYCISKYPTLPKDICFNAVDFNKYSGFSDHTVGIAASLVAMARGAKIIEKHFTLDKNMHGPDHKGSMNPEELSNLVNYGKQIESILYH